MPPVRFIVRFLRAIALLGAIALPIGGCAHLATPEEKQVSYRRFESVSVSGIQLSDFLEQRTVVVVAGAQPKIVSNRARDVMVRFSPIATDGFDIGSATAVDATGYYLTAGHCVPRRPVFLLVPTSNGARIVPGRVVWSAAKGAAFDFAILYAQTGNRPYFNVGENRSFDANIDVVTAGSNGLAGGKLMQSFNWPIPPAEQSPPAYAYVHSAPLAEGDSGGPLTTIDGQLLGIEILARGIVMGTTQGIALRPGAIWLKSLIEKDEQEHPAVSAATQP